ncbi:MAG: gamma carbonic anhydrase family protein [Opitutales bacterium]
MDVQERLAKYLSQDPQIDPTAFAHPNATLIGAVTMEAKSSVWPGVVVRADINPIHIGEGSNVQDGSVLHLSDDYGVQIGNYVTIGHMAMIHACTIEDECLIGMHATVLDGAVIGKNSIVGAGALVTKGKAFEPGSMILGSPAKCVRKLTEEEQAGIRYWAEKYIEVSKAHRAKLEGAL